MVLLQFVGLFRQARRYSIIGSSGDGRLVVVLFVWRHSEVRSNWIVGDLAPCDAMIRSRGAILNLLILSRFQLGWLPKTAADPTSDAAAASNTTADTTAATSNPTANRRLRSLLDHHRPRGDIVPKVEILHIDLL